MPVSNRFKKNINYWAFLYCLLATCFSLDVAAQKILVFSKTAGYRHESIAAGKKMFLELGRLHHITVDTTEDAAGFTFQQLKQYRAIVFLNTTGNILDTFQQQAFEKYIRRGGGFVGIHAATDTEYDWPWFNKLAGAYFESHPKEQQATYTITDKNFPATRNLPDTFSRFTEIYNYKAVQDGLHYLLTVDEKSYTGGKMGAFHPMSWYHTFEGGRVYYLGLGHLDTEYTDPLFVGMVLNGLLWTMKKEK